MLGCRAICSRQTETPMLSRAVVVRSRFLTSTLLGVFLCLVSHIAPAQTEFPPLSKVTQQPINPFTSKNTDTIRGSRVDLLAGKKLPRWRNTAEFANASLPHDLRDWRREGWTREAPFIQSEPGFSVRRMLDLLQIKLKDGRFVYFTDNDDPERLELQVSFEYRGYDKQRRFYFVSYRLYNAVGFLVISSDTGLIWFLYSPFWSPDRSRVASIGDSLNLAPFVVLRLSNGHATTEIFESSENPAGRLILGLGMDQISWRDERTVELSSTLDSPNRSDYRITLRMIDQNWKITSVEPEMPRFLILYPER